MTKTLPPMVAPLRPAYGSKQLRLVRSAVVTSVASAIVAVVGLSNQLVIASVFGASWHTDAYQVGLSVPTMIMGLTAGLSTHALVPALVCGKIDSQRHREFARLLLMCVCGIALLIAAGGVLGGRSLVTLVAPSLVGAAAGEAALVARVSSLNAGCFVVMSCLGAFHNASRRFLIPVLSTIPVYLGMTLAAAIWGNSAGVVSIAWGMLGGYLIAVPLLAWGALPELMAQPFVIRAGAAAPWTELRAVFRRMPLVLISMLCFTMYATVDAIWASRLGPAELSALAYCQRVLVSLGTVITLGPATVLLPYLSEAVRENPTSMGEFSQRITRMVLVIALPVALILAMLRIPFVELLFERGAFTHAATVRVASLLPGMALGMVPMLCAVMLFKGFYANQDALDAAWVSGLGVLVYFVGSGVLSHAVGVRGIVAAYVLTWSAVVAACLWQLSGRSMRRIVTTGSALFVMKLGAALAAAAIILYPASSWIRYLGPLSWTRLAFLTGTAALLGGIVYAVVAHLALRIEEADVLLETVLGFFRPNHSIPLLYSI